ncbi:MAG: carboxypeptidase regulatory-like domain-containing protein, partial [Bacteroidales bacterium]|nr:carboxypeptidase regulatory-like domain-containing protein [Bacteroidales bacterium]
EYTMGLWAMPNNIDIKDNYVYMQENIDWTTTLITIDVTDPEAPQLAGEYQSSAKDMYAGNSFVYILDDNILKILDLQDPSNPSLEGSLTLSGDGLRICVNNGYAFIAGDGEYSLWTADVSNPANPQIISTLTTACNYTRDIFVRDSLLYLVCDQHFQIVDISDIYNPEIICTYDEVTGATGIYIAGNYAYIADYNLLKIDISDPEAPLLVESYPIPGCSYNVAVLDNYLYVTTESSFLIFRDDDLLTCGNINGTVTDINTGDPIENAIVSIEDISDTTGFDGTYLLENVPVGLYDVTCTAEGYYTLTIEDVDVLEDQTVTVDFTLDPITGINDIVPEVAGHLTNYPNPFKSITTIFFNISCKDAKIEIYNIKGQKVKSLIIGNSSSDNNRKSVVWDGTNDLGKPVGSGVYFYQLKIGNNFSGTKKMLLLK